jgi:hypothetical protein
MSIFEYRKPALNRPSRDSLETLKNTLSRLEAEPMDSARVAELKRILADRIAELEQQSA